MFNWRGQGAGHSHTLSDVDAARQLALNALQGQAPDFNETAEVMVSARRVRIVLNRNQRRVITMYTV